MARYLDSGSDDPTKCLGYWFNQNVVAGITGFHAQFGYYTYRALFPFGSHLHAAASAGHPVHLVLGSNKGSLKEQDLSWTFDLIRNATDASLKVMAFGNAEFHPKTVCVRRADGSLAAVVGSSNLTESGLGRNVEAMVSLDSNDDGQGLFQEIVDSTLRWQAGMPGVYPVISDADIDNLKAAKLINVPQPTSTRPGRDRGAVPGIQNPGTRVPIWVPADRPATPPPAPAAAPLPPLPAARLPLLWQKRLVASDCQRQRGHGTGGIRLVQARFVGVDGSVIDQTTYFRELFDGFNWYMTRRDPYVEDADILFRVIAKGTDFGVRLLTVSHKPTGEAGESNYTTILRWTGITTEVRNLDLRGLTLSLYGPAPGTIEPYLLEVE
jgi:hypothetical protein